jgi:DNA replication and repair protein RecF
MDVVLAQTDGRYLEALRRYRHALAQRNASLKEGRESLAASYEVPMVEEGALLRRARAGLAEFLGEHAGSTYRAIGGREESLGVAYRPNPSAADGTADEEVLAERLEKGRAGDLERGFTGSGPHRDDLRLTVADRSLAVYGSHGQVRTALAALKLGELEYVRTVYDRQPVLLMDEVASVLDRLRLKELLGLLGAHASQVLVTSPREADLGDLTSSEHRLLTVENGTARAAG